MSISRTYHWNLIESSTQLSRDHTAPSTPIPSGLNFPLRIDHFLKLALPDLSRNYIQKMIRSGAVKINGLAQSRPSTLLRGDESVLLHGGFTPLEKIEHIPLNESQPSIYKEIKILFEDDHVLVIFKPPGLAVHASAGHREHHLVDYLSRLYKLPTNPANPERPGIVHRLDLGTSGLLLVAKSFNALHKLQQQFRERSVSRLYEAVVWGHIDQKQHSIASWLTRNPRNPKTFCSASERSHPEHFQFVKKNLHLPSLGPLEQSSNLRTHGRKMRWARTDFLVLKRSQLFPLTFLRLKLFTGRTHQIRVHLTEFNHPIVGDRLYHPRFEKEKLSLRLGLSESHPLFQRMWLHAAKLSFVHPVSGKPLSFEWPWSQREVQQIEIWFP